MRQKHTAAPRHRALNVKTRPTAARAAGTGVRLFELVIQCPPMKCLACRLLTLCSAMSLLLCVAVCVLWVRSYWTRDLILFGRAGGEGHLVQSLLGRVHWMTDFGFHSGGLGQFVHQADALSPQAIWNGGTSGYPASVRWHFGLVWQTYDAYHADFRLGISGFITHHRLVVIPYWALGIPFALAPLGWAVSWFRRRWRFGAGLCPSCGYDLRATPGRCPECGTPGSVTTRT